MGFSYSFPRFVKIVSETIFCEPLSESNACLSRGEVEEETTAFVFDDKAEGMAE
jgi:hypothetical protein